ncbi:MAG: type IV pili methyl-accepting chemotaxis transducer N-terminal domain-containing protein [Kiloniellales bacterium]|nr:type IV pili methyl-accepting chemotaxis transducer N-terminal domain-containing protein [Kiloniellales bacterium]
MLKKSAIVIGCLVVIGIGVQVTGIHSARGVIAPARAAAGDVNFKHIINLAGRERMLSQKMSKEFLLVALGYNERENLRNLKYSRETFARVLKGLRFGDADLELQTVEDGTISARLSRVEELWPEFESLLLASKSKDSITVESVARIAEIRLPLLSAMHEAVNAYEELSNKDKKAFSLAERLVNIAGRQRMLTQKMSTEYLLIVYGHEVQENRKKLAETMATFEKFLTALLVGDPKERIIPAPTPRIRSQLRTVERVWQEFKPMMEAALKGGKIDQNAIADVASLNVTLLTEMDNAVDMYEAK